MPQRPSKQARRAAPLLIVIPPLLHFFLIHKYGVDLIDWDQWQVAVLFEKAAHGSLSLADLFAQQAEYRSFFPNLIFLGLGWLTHWNIKDEMFVSFLLACLVAFNLYRLGKFTVGGNGVRLPLLTGLANLLIFAPAQFENWLLGEQIIYFMPVACMTTGLLVAYSQFRVATKLSICMLLATVSTFSAANGILCWLTLFPVLLFSFRTGRRGLYYVYAGVWVVGFVSNLAGYLFDYHDPSFTPSLSFAFAQPLRALLFFFALLGAPLSTNYRFVFVAIALGAILTVLFAAACLNLVRSLRERATAYRFMGWLMLGAYSFMTAIIVTIARAGFGLDQAIISRYTTFSVYLIIALLYITAIILADLDRSARLAAYVRPLRRGALMALSLLILLHLLNSAAAIRQMSFMRARRLQRKACLLFINAVPDECLRTGFPAFPALDLLSHRANAMNELHFLRPPLIKSNRIEEIEGETTARAGSYGSFEKLVSTDGTTYNASGWAGLPDKDEPADAVLLVYQRAGESPLIFALATVQRDDSVFATGLARDHRADWHWQESFLLKQLPILPASLSAWAFDATTGKAYKLDGTQVIAQ
jgi:hypothetical protein